MPSVYAHNIMQLCIICYIIARARASLHNRFSTTASSTSYYGPVARRFSQKQVENNLVRYITYSNCCKRLSLHVLVMGIESMVEAMIHKEFCPAE